MNQKLVPMPFPFHSLWTNYRDATQKETITYKQSDQPHKKQQIYVVYHHYIYYTYIYLYISLNITKYLLLVHCTKMIFKQGTKDESIFFFKWAKNWSENVSEVRESNAAFLCRVEICAVQWCVCNKVWWLCCTRQKGWHHWFEVGWLMDVFQHTHTHTHTHKQVYTHTHTHIHMHIKTQRRPVFTHTHFTQQQRLMQE